MTYSIIASLYTYLAKPTDMTKYQNDILSLFVVTIKQAGKRYFNQYILTCLAQVFMYEARVIIGLKKGISDPEGANTLKALQLLGFTDVKEAKTIRTIELLINATSEQDVKKQVEQMCQRLLTNPVIHTYDIKIQKK